MRRVKVKDQSCLGDDRPCYIIGWAVEVIQGREESSWPVRIAAAVNFCRRGSDDRAEFSPSLIVLVGPDDL